MEVAAGADDRSMGMARHQASRHIGRHRLQSETVEDCIAAIGQRQSASRSSTTASTRAGECRIKGNISNKGRIYHMPGSASYAATRIDKSKGESVVL